MLIITGAQFVSSAEVVWPNVSTITQQLRKCCWLSSGLSKSFTPIFMALRYLSLLITNLSLACLRSLTLLAASSGGFLLYRSTPLQLNIAKVLTTPQLTFKAPNFSLHSMISLTSLQHPLWIPQNSLNFNTPILTSKPHLTLHNFNTYSS